MKKILLFIAVVGIISTSCDFQDEGELYNYIDTFSICCINNDGSGYRKIIDKEYTRPPKAIYFIDNNNKIIIVEYDRIREVDIVNLESNYYNFGVIKLSALSKDRFQLALIKEGNGDQDIYIFNTNSKLFTKVTNSPTIIKRGVSFSNDGLSIVYSTFFTSYSTIETVNLSSGTVTELARTNENNIAGKPFVLPIFNYNDTEVFYFSFENRANYVNHICKLRSSHNYVIDDTTNANGGLTLSGSNGFIIYDEMESYPWRLISHNLTLNIKNILGDINYVGVTVSVSNDGLKVLYGFTGSYSNEDIILVNIDGSSKKYLSKGQMPSLSSDGLKATFVVMEKIRNTY
jgi:translation initiation factor 6 (eIF-6)